MKAVCWMGTEKLSVENVPDPRILNPRDAIVRITKTAICGSDLHLFDGFIPTMEQGDILGHEFMGEVVEVGPGIEAGKLKQADRWWCRSPSPAATAGSANTNSGRCAITPTRSLIAAKSCTASPAPDSSGIRTCWGAMPEDRRNMPACPSRISVPSRFRWPARRAGLVSLRHFPDRLHGCRKLRHRAGRRRRRVGMRPGGTIRHSQRLPAGRRERDRN